MRKFTAATIKMFLGMLCMSTVDHYWVKRFISQRTPELDANLSESIPAQGCSLSVRSVLLHEAAHWARRSKKLRPLALFLVRSTSLLLRWSRVELLITPPLSFSLLLCQPEWCSRQPFIGVHHWHSLFSSCSLSLAYECHTDRLCRQWLFAVGGFKCVR